MTLENNVNYRFFENVRWEMDSRIVTGTEHYRVRNPQGMNSGFGWNIQSSNLADITHRPEAAEKPIHNAL